MKSNFMLKLVAEGCSWQVATSNELHVMRNCHSILNRRNFFWLIAGLAANFALTKLSFGGAPRPKISRDDGFLIINGWVLTREDIKADFNVI
jgi:hypothetical protein